MAIATEQTAQKFINVVAAVPCNCNFPLFVESEAEVVYGVESVVAELNVDYTVTLMPDDFDTFTVTPTVALLTKINDLIAADTAGLEVNYITIRRKLNYLTSVEPETVRQTAFLSREIERIAMKFLQLSELLNRALRLPAKFIGDVSTPTTLPVPEDGKALVWDGTSGALKNVGASSAVTGVTVSDRGVVLAPGGGDIPDGQGGQYQTIVGGRNNNVSCDSNDNTIVGGNGNEIGGACAESTIIGGDGNRVSDSNSSLISGGDGNTVQGGSDNAINGGTFNEISGGNGSGIVGGFSNTLVNSDYQGVVGGRGHVLQADYAAAIGGRDNTVNVDCDGASVAGRGSVASMQYQNVESSGSFSGDGDAQASRIVVRNVTANNTQTELFIDGVGASKRLVIPNDTTWAFSALIVARRTDADGESAGYEVKGVIDNNANTVALVGAVATTTIGEDNAGWDATAVADDVNKSLNFKVTGENAKTIRWVAGVRLTMVTG